MFASMIKVVWSVYEYTGYAADVVSIHNFQKKKKTAGRTRVKFDEIAFMLKVVLVYICS